MYSTTADMKGSTNIGGMIPLKSKNIYTRIEITPESIEKAKDSSILQVLQDAMREEEADFKKHLTAYLFGDAIKREDIRGWKRIKRKASDFLKLILSVFRFKR